MNLLKKLKEEIIQSDWTKRIREEKKMDKDKLMKFLSEAIDNGAGISITSYGREMSKKEAEKNAVELSNIINGKKEEVVHDTHQWFSAQSEKIRIDFFHEESVIKNFLEEDVDLSGGEEHATA